MLPECCLNHASRTWTCARAELVKALQGELRPLVSEARRLADDKNLAAAEVFRAVDRVRMWLDAALAVEDSRRG